MRVKNARIKVKKRRFMDYSLLFMVFFLLAFGLIMIYSASSYEAMLKFSDAAYYFRKQLIATGVGLIFMFVVMFMDYHIWGKISIFLYFGALVLVFLVKTSLGITANGATRWLRIGPMSFQPAEAAKVAIIILFAWKIAKMSREEIKDIKNIAMILGIGALMAGLIYILTSNMSSAIIVMGIGYLMLFIASPESFKYIALLAAGFGVAAAGAYMIISGIIPDNMSFRFARVKAWADPEAYASGKGFQTLQALYAIGSGGIFGKGLGQSMQKLDFLPEAQNDMIFSIICEELGLFGAACVIMAFAVLLWRCVFLANNAPDLYGSLLVVGVIVHIAVQVILNVAVVTNTIPNTGITLPFISYGGTSIVFLLIEMGLVLSVSRRIILE